MSVQRVDSPWLRDGAEVLKELESNPRGLNESDVQERLKSFGKNILPSDGRLGWLKILFNQFKSPLLIILAIAGGITLFLKEWGDSTIILGAVVVNACLGLYQELKAENTLALLQTLVKDSVRVTRNAVQLELAATDIVPGDIVHLRQGSKVPADGRILTSNDLQIDESVLTGESLSIEKSPDVLSGDMQLGDRKNMAWSGTTIVQGFGEMVVTATGASTELGKIARLVESAEQEETPLQRSLMSFTYRASIVLAGFTVVLFAFGLSSGIPLYEMFLISVATAVSAVPEGLPIALTVILAVGVERLARRKGVVRKLLAAETLGSTTLILTDKTGTLTEAKMELEAIVPHGADDATREHEALTLLEYVVTHSDVLIENPHEAPDAWKITGSPVEVALVRGAARKNTSFMRLREEFKILDRLPFNSSTKFSASLVEGRGKTLVVLFGAPEIVLPMTSASQNERKDVLQEVDERAGRGERVLAVAVKEISNGDALTLAKHAESRDIGFLGLVTFKDKIREGVGAAIKRIADAGVRTVIVTGDHAGTASTIAREVGFQIDDASVVLGSEIASLDDDGLKAKLRTAKVIARTTPEQKLRIARAYKSLGEIVAMTGDGVNDAPALREANIGIAVGAGTDVAKASADLVILDNNFETIVAAIEEGRSILQNIRKVIVYMLSNSFDELFLIGGALLFGLSIPLTALQILWVNLLTDSFPAISLAFESHKSDIGKSPSKIHGKLFDREMQFLIMVVGAITSALLLGMYIGLLRLGYDPAIVKTFVFASFGVYSLFLIYSVRSLHASIFSYGFFTNTYLLWGTAVGFVMMASAVYLPLLQGLFGTVPLTAPWLAGVFAFGITAVALREVSKWLFRHGFVQL